MQKTIHLIALIILWLLSPSSTIAQDMTYEKALKIFHLKEIAIPCKGNDSIYFLTTLPDAKKKTIIFCQGSGPVPLITTVPPGVYPPFPFSIDSATRKEFNIIIISKPGLKRFATPADISDELLKKGQILQLDSNNLPPEKYIANNKLAKLAGDCQAVIEYLKKQTWVDKDNIYLFGHSQGAVVAAYTAFKNQDKIKGLIYSQANAYGMYAEYLSTLLNRYPNAQDLNQKMDSIYNLQKELLSGTQGGETYDKNTSRWSSLEEPPAIDYLLKTDIPILLINGMASYGEMDNKNIPLDFIRHHKHNLTTKFYPGYDHNFFKQVTDEKGNPSQPEFHWDDIFNEVKKWIKEQK